MKNFFQNLFKDKRNISGFIAVLFGFISIILFLTLPAIVISLTPDGVEIAKNTPGMEEYTEILSGIGFLFGGTTVDVWETTAAGNKLVGVLTAHNVNFNLFGIIGLALILISSAGLLVQTLFDKNNIINKFILGGYVVGTILILLTPVWFYAVNSTIMASSRYDTVTSMYIHSAFNANIGLGALLSTVAGIIGSVASGVLIIKPQEENR